MANFEPKWDLIADDNTIQEGQSTYFRLRVSKNNNSDSTSYKLAQNEVIQFIFTITGSGETLEERDFVITAGEKLSYMVKLTDLNTGSARTQGTHQINFSTKEYQLSGDYLDAWFFKIECVQDGVWDGPQSLRFNIDTISVISTEDDQIISNIPAGSTGVSTQVLNYSTANEVWLTPDLKTHGNNLYTIGGVGYGSESRLFVQAYGNSTVLNGVPSVYMPAYEVLEITEDEIPDEHITGAGTILLPDLSTGATEEIPLLVKDPAGNLIGTGMKFNTNNGQIVQTMLYDSEPVDAYIKIGITSVKGKDTDENSGFYPGKRFRAYNTWIAPDDVSDFYEVPEPGHLYQLKDTSVYPYVVSQDDVEGRAVTVFESSKWYNLGKYSDDLGAGIIGSTRIFRILLNDNSGTDISFETDSDLGQIHVGEYFGHTVYPKIVASGSDLITYTIKEDTSPDDITKFNLDLSSDGTLIGTAYAASKDFTANDDIPLEFDVVATGKNGNSITQRFKIRLVRGFGQNVISASILPALTLERQWFRMIASAAFSTAILYRESDPRYGVRRLPRIMLKENYTDTSLPWEGIKKTIKDLRNSIIDPVNGAPTPTGSFRLVLGNYKVRSALDNAGNVLYDVLYREVHPAGTQVPLSMSPMVYTDYSTSGIAEIHGLRQNIYTVLGEDTTNLLTDPTDLNNRGVVVDAISGLSDEMIDTVPRFMNHPYVEGNIKSEYFPCIVVAYLAAGQGEQFFNTLLQNNEHKEMLNTEFEVSGVEFSYFVQDNKRYKEDIFIAALKVPNLYK